MYNLFISHSWTYDSEYNRLTNLLDSHGYFRYKNYSVPKNDPIHNANNDTQLRAAIRRQMQPASCILILAGVYSTYSKWINIEIELAKEMNKRIIAIEPWGAQRTSSVVKKSADVCVKWQGISIIEAIKI
ncbi:MAG: TIR domain-containing protein [Culicoidibacterales bacterium]